MSEQEVEHTGKHPLVAQALPQVIGREAGQRQEPLSAPGIFQNPSERGQSQRLGIRTDVSLIDDCVGSRRTSYTAQTVRRTFSVAKRILVVEDNDLNRKLFCDVLRAHGYAVEPVSDGSEALGRARSYVPNLIVMDIQLPNLSGLELIESLKSDRDLRQIPILAVTAYAGRGDEERIREAGAEGYLSKPVSIKPFVAAVKGLA